MINSRDAILCDIDETLAVIRHKEELLQIRPSRSQALALEGFRVQLDCLRAELAEFDADTLGPGPLAAAATINGVHVEGSAHT